MSTLGRVENAVNSLSRPAVLAYGAGAIAGEFTGGFVLSDQISDAINNTSAYEAAQVKIKPLKDANNAITTVTTGGVVLRGTTPKESSVAVFLNTRKDKNSQEIKKLEARQPDQLPAVVEGGLGVGLCLAGLAAGVAVVYSARRAAHAVKSRIETHRQPPGYF